MAMGEPHEGEGQDEAEGPHLTVSGLGAGVVRRLVVGLITIRCFRMSALKREMVSSGRRIVSSLGPDETISGKSSMI